MTFNVTPCVSITENACLTNAVERFFSLNELGACSSQCPEECSTESFSASMSVSEFPNYKYAERLIEQSSYLSNVTANISSEFERYLTVKRNVLSVNFYYDRLSYTLIQESPKTEISDLVSNIGGLAGLFLGVSFLSFVEVFELLFDLVRILVNSKNENKIGAVEQIQIN
jgi:hypothetical protein